jgi:hypothetical protein
MAALDGSDDLAAFVVSLLVRQNLRRLLAAIACQRVVDVCPRPEIVKREVVCSLDSTTVPWGRAQPPLCLSRACSLMDERARFAAGLLSGDSMDNACTELGISFKTGYKFLAHCEKHDRERSSDRCLPPTHYAK